MHKLPLGFIRIELDYLVSLENSKSLEQAIQIRINAKPGNCNKECAAILSEEYS